MVKSYRYVEINSGETLEIQAGSRKEAEKELRASTPRFDDFTRWESEMVQEIIEQVQGSRGITEKEKEVLKAMFVNTIEFGLPVEVDEIKIETGFNKRSIVGIISSLYKKGLVEGYGNIEDDEFMLSETGYDKAELLLD